MAEIVKLGKILEKANLSALNRAAKSAVSEVNSFIREKFNFKKRDLDKHIRIISKASKETPFVRVIVSKPEISLIKFNAKQFGKPGRSKRRKGPRLKQGVKATVIKGQRQLFRSADKTRGSFIWKDDQVERGVFIRTGNKKIMTKGKFEGREREQIVKLFGVDLVKLFDTKSGESLVVQRMHEVFDIEYQKRLEHELNYRLTNEK